ncbi:hypothetical protein [Parendozoicomonas sp. Alg238-R29]|uniref:hypothetical protein n=1 Tax=Parendozoicomonas sp. Alg238-R29 TaxID=2993446 RepID=UPI00248D828D|nr:hypothetical protein [Parendozoicomonas sp. Alg238-R29]
MRFSELINNENPASMSLGKLIGLVDNWLARMASWRYTRDTRTEHVQQALDQVYTSLERKLKITSSQQIMTDPLWKIMVKLIAKHFPNEVEIYYPTPVEQQRKLMLIRNSIATGIIKDKQRLLHEFMTHHEYKVKTLSELAHSRIKLQILAASSRAVLGRYQGSIYDGWETWYRWANRRDRGRETDTQMEVEESTLAVGKAVVRGEAKAMIGRNFEYDSRDTHGGSPWRHQVKAGGALYVEGGGEAVATYNREQLNTAAAAGIEAEAGMRGDVEVETEYAFAVTNDEFRRMFGNKFKMFHAKAEAHSKLGAGGSAGVSARAGLGGQAGAGHTYEPMDTENPSGTWAESGNIGVCAGGEANIWIGFTVTGNAELTVAQALELGISGEMFAGAKAGAEGGFFVESGGVRCGASAEVFAGFEAAVEERVAIKHPKRALTIFSVKGRQAFTAGVGAGASAEFAAGIDRFSLKAESQTTLGIGGKITTDFGISPLALGLAAYDMAIVPSLWMIKKKLNSSVHTKNSSFAKHMNRVVEAVDSIADVSEVRALSRECNVIIASCIAALDQGADHLYKQQPRKPGASYGAMPDEHSVAGFTGHSQSSFYTYAAGSGRKTGVDENALTDAFSKLQVASDTWYKGASDANMRKPVDINLLAKTVNTDVNYDWMFAKFATQDRRYGT